MDYETDKNRAVHLTKKGVKLLEDQLGIDLKTEERKLEIRKIRQNEGLFHYGRSVHE